MQYLQLLASLGTKSSPSTNVSRVWYLGNYFSTPNHKIMTQTFYSLQPLLSFRKLLYKYMFKLNKLSKNEHRILNPNEAKFNGVQVTGDFVTYESWAESPSMIDCYFPDHSDKFWQSDTQIKK